MRTRVSRSVWAAGVALVAISVCPGQNPQPASQPASKVPAASGQPAPRLVLSSNQWDFGQVWYGDPCRTEVDLKNAGSAPLKITDVKSSCGCTVAKPHKTLLAPGESVAMTVSYNTRKNVKRVYQAVTIYSNDPLKPQVKFYVKGEVWHVFDARPYARLAFGLLSPTASKTVSIELHNNLKEKVFPKLKPLAANLPFVVKLEQVEPGMTYKLVAHTKPPLKLGTNYTTIYLETGVKRLPEMRIPISAVALERVSVRPDHLWLTSTQNGPRPRIVMVHYPKDQDLEITAIHSSDPSVTVAKTPLRRPPMRGSDFASYQIRLMLPAFSKFPDQGVRIEIDTNDPEPRFQKLMVRIAKRPVYRRPAPGPTSQPARTVGPGTKLPAAPTPGTKPH